MSQSFYISAYRKAKRPEDLPWHREEMPEWLLQAVAKRTKTGRFLDLGSGTGVFSVQLAQKGYDVTSVDFTPEALHMAEDRARSAGVKVNFVHADVLTWEGAGVFDIVLDSGCFHSLKPAERPRYKTQLLKWLTPNADYVLIHFGRRHFLDWWPMGPRRRNRQEIGSELAPQLSERNYKEHLEEAPLPVGPTILICEYWFQKER